MMHTVSDVGCGRRLGQNSDSHVAGKHTEVTQVEGQYSTPVAFRTGSNCCIGEPEWQASIPRHQCPDSFDITFATIENELGSFQILQKVNDRLVSKLSIDHEGDFGHDLSGDDKRTRVLINNPSNLLMSRIALID